MSGSCQQRRVVARGLGAAGRQRGLSLITALLFMVATLILGVSVMSINVMQERMIGNTKDHDLAMQAAEAALRDGELDVAELAPTAVFSDDCSAGLCTPPSQRAAPSQLPVHQTAGFSWATDAKVRKYGQYTDKKGTHPIDAFPLPVPKPELATSQPRYVIEKLGTMGVVPGESLFGPRRVAYRITARATGARDDTVVILQSIYARLP